MRIELIKIKVIRELNLLSKKTITLLYSNILTSLKLMSVKTNVMANIIAEIF
jgi:hypothetical protein